MLVHELLNRRQIKSGVSKKALTPQQQATMTKLEPQLPVSSLNHPAKKTDNNGIGLDITPFRTKYLQTFVPILATRN